MKSQEMMEKQDKGPNRSVLIRYNIAKAVLLGLLIVFIAVLLAGNAGSEKSVDEIVPHVVPDLVQAQEGTQTPDDGGNANEQPSEDEGVFDGMGQATALDFKRIFGLNAEDYDGVAYFKPISQMDVEELLIVKMKSNEQKEALEETVRERVDSQKTSFDGYGAAQCALLEKAIIKTKGNYLFYCVSPDAGEYYEAFLDAM